MKVALFKLTQYYNHDNTGQPFIEGRVGDDWTRVSEWAEVEFQPIEVDIEAVQRDAHQKRIDELKKQIDALQEKLP